MSLSPADKAIIEARKTEATKKGLFRTAVDIAKKFGTKTKKQDDEHFEFKDDSGLTVHARAYEEHCWDTSYLIEVTVKQGERTVFSAYGDDGLSYNHTVTGFAPGKWESVFNAAAKRTKKPESACSAEELKLRRKWGI